MGWLACGGKELSSRTLTSRMYSATGSSGLHFTLSPFTGGETAAGAA